MREAKALTYGIALGAAVMFLMDPRQGGARRARIRDKSVRAVHEVEHAAAIGARDMSHRAEGLVARLRSSPPPVSPDVLVERVRSVLGRTSSHPHAIRVLLVTDGRVALTGPVLASEVDDVLSAVSRVRGVEAVDNNLEVYENGGSTPGLQGGVLGHHRSVFHVAPATKLAGGVLAALLAFSSLVRGHPFGLLLGGAGVLAFARSMNARGSWRPLRTLSRRRRRRRALEREASAFEETIVAAM